MLRTLALKRCLRKDLINLNRLKAELRSNGDEGVVAMAAAASFTVGPSDCYSGLQRQTVRFTLDALAHTAGGRLPRTVQAGRAHHHRASLQSFSGRLFASHWTHSPTLLVDACHALCRLVGLITTVLAYKYERADENTGREGRLRNTFGWARIEVVGRLSVHVLFASFALALVVNAMQLGVHSSHHHGQPPRHSRVIVGCAVIGLLLYAINYLLLAGRELSYSRRLSMTEDGEVVLKSGAGEPVLAHAPTDIASKISLP
ncbi:cation efflux family domain-containing protein [Phthorimaea operculella]|nr:cation efflux family domain-containing protein [Phthorimaea operculella]